MKLFKFELVRGGRMRDVIAHGDTLERTRAHVARRHTGWRIASTRELEKPAYFVVAEFDIEPPAKG